LAPNLWRRRPLPTHVLSRDPTGGVMGYDPFEHRPAARDIVAAWVICLGIAGLGLALTVGREVLSANASAQPAHTMAGGLVRCPMAGVRIPLARPTPDKPSALLGSRFLRGEPANPRGVFGT
jgi:hypothetical protein